MNVFLFCNNLFLIHHTHCSSSSLLINLDLGIFPITKSQVPFHLSSVSSRISNACKSFCHYFCVSPATARALTVSIMNECHCLLKTICFSFIKHIVHHVLHSSFILILGTFLLTNWSVPFHLSWDSSRISNACKSFCHYFCVSPATASALPISVMYECISLLQQSVSHSSYTLFISH
jgi:hypothetical protein